MHNRLQWLCGHLRKIYALVKVLVHLAHNCTARPRTRIFVGLCTGKSGGAGLACLWNVRAVKQRQQQRRRRSAWHAHVVTANDIQPQWHLLHAHVRGKHPLEALLEDHIERLVEACAGSGSRGVEGWSVVIAIKAARSWAAPFRHPMMLRPSLVMTDTVRSKRASIHYHSPGPRRAEQRFQKLSSLFIFAVGTGATFAVVLNFRQRDVPTLRSVLACSRKWCSGHRTGLLWDQCTVLSSK